MAFTIVKADEAQRVVYGWGSISIDATGLVTDRQGDQIEPDELDSMVVEFMVGVDDVFERAEAIAEALADGSIDAQTGTTQIHNLILLSTPSGVMHEGKPVAKVIASLVTMPEIVSAFFKEFIPADLLAKIPIGWMLGVKVFDDETWQGVLDGRFRAFSVQGSAERVAA